MEPGSYLVVPFVISTEHAEPALWKFGERTWVATIGGEPFQEWRDKVVRTAEMAASRKGWSSHDVANVKYANHLLIVQQGDSASGEPEEPFHRFGIEEPPQRRWLSKLPLPAEVNRLFASLLVSARTGLWYTSCFAMRVRAGDCDVEAIAPTGSQGRTRQPTSSDYSLQPLNQEMIDRARVIFANLTGCKDGSRLAIAADTFRRALFEEDWRLEIVLMTIALEALFSLGERQELVHQISERAAALVYDRGPDRLRAYQCVKELYHLRSQIVHGALAGARDNKKVEKALSKLDAFEDTVRHALCRILADEELVRVFRAKDDTLRDYFLRLILNA